LCFISAEMKGKLLLEAEQSYGWGAARTKSTTLKERQVENDPR